MLSMRSVNDAGGLPPFANTVNRQLDAEIKVKESKLTQIEAILSDHQERIQTMQDHMRNVQQEFVHSQSLFESRTREIETEEHMKMLSERESGRLLSEIQRVEKDIATIVESMNNVQNSIFRGNERIETLRNDLKIEKNDLEEWARVQREKEEDNIALLKYQRADENKIKELNLNIERLQHEVNQKKNQLSNEVTETQVAQVELDKTTVLFRELHLERQELVRRWEQAIQGMSERDKQIQSSSETFRELKNEIDQKQKVINEKQKFLNEQIEKNLETEKKIAIQDRTLSKYKIDHQQIQENLVQFQDEVESLRNTLNRTANDLESKKTEIQNLKNELLEKHKRLEKERKVKAEVKVRLAQATDSTVSLETKAKQLQEILKKDELRDKEVERDLKLIKEQQFKSIQELHRLKQQEKNLHAEIAGSEAANKNLQHEISKLDQEVLKQQEMLYNQDFQIQQLERKVRRAQGERTDEEKEVLLKKIEHLTQLLDQQTAKHTLLNTQLKKLQDDLRQAQRKVDQLTKEKDTWVDRIDELQLHNESAVRQLKKKEQEKEDLMVEENILKLELRRLRATLNAHADEVFSLENRQAQLQLALEERSKEIEIHTEMLKVQIKLAEEERYSANAELRDRLGKVEKLKRKYEIIVTRFASEEGEEDHSQAYYVIRAAQQREELQREGDQLDSEIRKAEKEIRALENTLKLMNNRNETYRQGLSRAEIDGEDMEQKEALEQQFKACMDKYKYKRKEIQDMQEELVALETQLNELIRMEEVEAQQVAALESRISGVTKEITEQEVKKERAEKQVESLARELRKSQNSPLDLPTSDEADFAIKEQRDVNLFLLQKIAELVERNPEISQAVNILYDQAGIVAPSSRSNSRSNLSGKSGSGANGAGSNSSSRSGSVRSSVSSSMSNASNSSLTNKPISIKTGPAKQVLSASQINVSLTPGAAGSTPRSSSQNLDAKAAPKVSRPGSASSASSHGSVRA